MSQPTNNRPLRFRRWSRKAYAAFISIQHHVTIGQLSAHIADRFQVKNQSLHAASCSEKSARYEAVCMDEQAEKTSDLLQAIASVWAATTQVSVAEPSGSYQQAHTIDWTDYHS